MAKKQVFGKESTNTACPAERTLFLIGTKWTALIMHRLSGEKCRFGELARKLDGISPRTLSARLAELEREGIVTKTIFPEVPPRTEYALTPKGKALAKIIGSIDAWSNRYGKQRTARLHDKKTA